MRPILVCLLLPMLASCSPDISGTWTEESGLSSYEFQDSGQARITVLGTTVAARYRIDDDQVVVSSPQGTVVLTLRDGRLFGPMGLALSRDRQ